MPLTGEAKKLYNKKRYDEKKKKVEADRLKDMGIEVFYESSTDNSSSSDSEPEFDYDAYLVGRSLRMADAEEKHEPMKQMKDRGYTTAEVVKMVVQKKKELGCDWNEAIKNLLNETEVTK